MNGGVPGDEPRACQTQEAGKIMGSNMGDERGRKRDKVPNKAGHHHRDDGVEDPHRSEGDQRQVHRCRVTQDETEFQETLVTASPISLSMLIALSSKGTSPFGDCESRR